MLDKWLAWYMYLSQGKVQCLMCQVLFARKVARMLSHLGYKGPLENQDKGVSLCKKAIAEIKTIFHRCVGVVPIPMSNWIKSITSKRHYKGRKITCIARYHTTICESKLKWWINRH